MSDNLVFVVQRPAYFDRTRRGWVNKYDLTPATEHGELKFLLRPGNIFRDRLQEAVEQLEAGLAQFKAGDHILAVGDPVAISAAVMIASRNAAGGRVSILKFDRQENAYRPYPIQLSETNG
ncbi:hypothetical protein P67b_00027 [Ruegeria phage Tedan]|nr:hypothetical protein P67b_00027 [Ruegeria phage Tedan]